MNIRNSLKIFSIIILVIFLAGTLIVALSGCGGGGGGSSANNTSTSSPDPTDTDSPDPSPSPSSTSSPSPSPSPSVTPDEFGDLEVNSDPTGAKIIFVDEDGNQTDSGFTTPHTFEDFAAGEYNILLNLNNYDAYTETVTVNDGETTTVDATLVASTKGKLYLTVVDEDGNPVADVFVRLTYNAEVLYTGYTDANGELSIFNIDVQDYDATMTKTGYSTTSIGITIIVGNNYETLTIYDAF